MREYRPQRSAVLFSSVLFLLSFGLGAFVILALLSMQAEVDTQARLWLYVPILVLFVGGAAALGAFILSSLATFRVDPSGITGVVLRQEKQLLWRDVVDFEARRSLQSGTTWTLTAAGGRTLKVPINLLERGYGLEGFLEAYAAPLREQKRGKSPLEPQVYRYGKSMGTLMLVCGLVFLCFLVGAARLGPSWGVVLPISIPVLASLATAAYYFSYAVRITPEAITESSLFWTKTLPFSQIAAFYSGEMPTSNGQIQSVTEVVGKNGKKIKVNAQLINYDALTAALRSVMEASVLEQGQQEKVVVSRNARREQAKIMMVVGPLTLVLVVGMGILLGGDAFTRLARQNRLDREGRWTRGLVTGRGSQREGRSATGYYLNFEFQVAGQTYRRQSPVNWDDYKSLSNGAPTRVIYVPADPTISRMAASIGRRKAIGELAGHGLYALLVIPTGLYMFFRGRKTLRAEDETGGLLR